MNRLHDEPDLKLQAVVTKVIEALLALTPEERIEVLDAACHYLAELGKSKER